MRPPRLRGGVPVKWFDRAFEGEVLPADAGVFRRRRASEVPWTGPPRLRGGVPLLKIELTLAVSSSPPTRGCSVQVHPAGGRQDALPADAGVFRGPCRRRSSSTGPSRRRGGVPAPMRTLTRPTTSSPPARGCSDHGGGARARTRVPPPMRGCSELDPTSEEIGLVLPADAEVFRLLEVLGGVPGGPSRRRGGVPSCAVIRARSCVSSPPTRGCSDGPADVVHRLRVLPADAGVFRRVLPPVRHLRRPPRRRGGGPSRMG